MFITTANTLHMPQPLMDRMEIIRIPGYTEDEKVEIAKRHLIPKEMKAHGLKDDEWKITDDALRDLIRYYTREAGVRNLEREIANLTRKAVKEIVSGKATIGRSHARQSRQLCRRAEIPLRRDGRRGSGRRRHRPGLDGSRRRHAADRIRHAARQGPHADHRQARRRDEGIDRRGALLCALQGDELRHQAAHVRHSATSMCTCRKARRPRTDRRPASPWRRPSSRCSPAFRCAAMWR